MITAVDYLHNIAHLIHRDLKPENILIGDDGHIILSDLGTITTRNEEEGKSKRRNTMCGTILYLAPEVFPCLLFDLSLDCDEQRNDSSRRYLVDWLYDVPFVHGLFLV